MSIYQQLVELCKEGKLEAAKSLVAKYTNTDFNYMRALKIMSRSTDVHVNYTLNKLTKSY